VDGDTEPELLDAIEGPLMAVGDDGLIAYANQDALDLLGWDLGLVGRPLFHIIPVRLRERHRAGFARYLHSGESRLQGGTVRVPALLYDGSEQMIDLTIRVYRRPDGTKLAVAGLLAAELGTPPPGLRVLEDALAKRLYELL
jgi:PAS domain S-box-containing protein